MFSLVSFPSLWSSCLRTNINPLYPFMQDVSLDSRVRALVVLAIVAKVAPLFPWTPTRKLLDFGDILPKRIVLLLLGFFSISWGWSSHSMRRHETCNDFRHLYDCKHKSKTTKIQKLKQYTMLYGSKKNMYGCNKNAVRLNKNAICMAAIICCTAQGNYLCCCTAAKQKKLSCTAPKQNKKRIPVGCKKQKHCTAAKWILYQCTPSRLQ